MDKRACLERDLLKAKENFEAAYEKLASFEREKFAQEGNTIYSIPFTYSVSGMHIIYAQDYESACWQINELIIPPGEYVDDSFVINPGKESQESLILGKISKK